MRSPVTAIDAFAAEFAVKWPKAVARIVDDAEPLLAFYDFPAEHWIHLKTTNPIESTFATVRLRTKVTKGPGSRAAGLAMAFKLIEAAEQRWRSLNAPHLVALVRAGTTFDKGGDDRTTHPARSGSRRVINGPTRSTVLVYFSQNGVAGATRAASLKFRAVPCDAELLQRRHMRARAIPSGSLKLRIASGGTASGPECSTPCRSKCSAHSSRSSLDSTAKLR